MADFDTELSRMVTDAVATLGTRIITLRKPTAGALNAATRQRETGYTDAAPIAAIRDDDMTSMVAAGPSTARSATATYTVRRSDLAEMPTRQWRLLDDGVEWQITEVTNRVDDKAVDLACTRAG